MTYVGAVGRWRRLGDELLVPCSTSSGRDHFEPIPYSWAEGLTSLISGGMMAEPLPTLDTSGTAADPPALAGSSGTAMGPPTPASTSGAGADPPILADS